MPVIFDGTSGLIIPNFTWLTPQGRLTLSSGTPVPNSSTTAATSIYYTPYTGGLIPIYDGTNWILTYFTELTNTTTNSTVNPAACTTNSNYDLFVWNDSGTIRLCRGPAWSSDTSRGTGAGTTELQRINGLWTNKVAITNGPGANKGTYVGTVRTDGSSQCNWVPTPAGAAGGAESKLHVFNAYNRVTFIGQCLDTTASWSYATATWRSMNNSTTNRISYIDGLTEVNPVADLVMGVNAGSAIYNIGINRDSTSANPTISSFVQPPSSINMNAKVGGYFVPSLGYHYLQAMEAAGNGSSFTVYGNTTLGMAGIQVTSLSASLLL